MRKYLIILFCLSVTSVVLGQKNRTLDSLLRLRSHFANTGKDDSLIMVCQEINSADFKLTQAEKMEFDIIDLDADIVDAYFRLRKYTTAVNLAKKYLRMFAIRGSFKWDIYQINKYYVCLNLYDYYKNMGDNKTALKYILLAGKKYEFGMCGNGIETLLINRYQKLVDCYEALNDKNKANKYRMKIQELNKN